MNIDRTIPISIVVGIALAGAVFFARPAFNSPGAIQGGTAPSSDQSGAVAALLAFRPALVADQTTSRTLKDRVLEFCGHIDDVGTDRAPGTFAARTLPSGWVHVDWTLQCNDGGNTGEPDQARTFAWSISPDGANVRPVDLQSGFIIEVGM